MTLTKCSRDILLFPNISSVWHKAAPLSIGQVGCLKIQRPKSQEQASNWVSCRVSQAVVLSLNCFILRKPQSLLLSFFSWLDEETASPTPIMQGDPFQLNSVDYMWITDPSTFLACHLLANIWTTGQQSQAKMTFTFFITVGKQCAERHHLPNRISSWWSVSLALVTSSKICSLASEATWDNKGNLRQWWVKQKFGVISLFIWAKWLQGMKWSGVMQEMTWWVYCPSHLPAPR